MRNYDWKAIFIMIVTVLAMTFATYLIPESVRELIGNGFKILFIIMWCFIGILYLLRGIGFDTSKILREYEKCDKCGGSGKIEIKGD